MISLLVLDEPVSLLLSTDKSEYFPGDVVTVSGKPNKLIYLEKFDVSVIQKLIMKLLVVHFIVVSMLDRLLV